MLCNKKLNGETLILESSPTRMILAGLLTYSIFERPSHSLLNSGFEYCSKTFGGAYSSGSVQDLHLIPFSSFSTNVENDTKIGAKVDIFAK